LSFFYSALVLESFRRCPFFLVSYTPNVFCRGGLDFLRGRLGSCFDTLCLMHFPFVTLFSFFWRVVLLVLLVFFRVKQRGHLLLHPLSFATNKPLSKSLSFRPLDTLRSFVLHAGFPCVLFLLTSPVVRCLLVAAPLLSSPLPVPLESWSHVYHFRATQGPLRWIAAFFSPTRVSFFFPCSVVV